MTLKFDLSAADLGALLCSKVCHDVISPVGALNNALELLDEPGAAEDALDLVRSSARTASARLQFCRIAFGASGSASAHVDTGDARKVTDAYMADERASVEWASEERRLLPKNKVKLLLNLVLIAAAAIPRGGTVHVSMDGPDEAVAFRLHATGKRVRIPVAFDEMMDGDLPENGVDAHVVQPYYTMLLAREAGMALGVELGETDVTITAAPEAMRAAA